MTFSRTTRRRALKLGLAASLAAPAVARAQAWPSGPIVFLNPFPAGGGTDTFCRPLAAQVGDQLGQQIIVDNKGGAGGTVGASLAAKAKPDGSLFFVGAVHDTIARTVYKHLDYDLEKSFEPVTMIALVPQVISVNPQRLPMKTAAEFIDYARTNPGKGTSLRRAPGPRTISRASCSSSRPGPSSCTCPIAARGPPCRTCSPAMST